MRPGGANTGITTCGASSVTGTSTTGCWNSERALPRLRTVVYRHLEARGLGRDRVLAAAVRLIDLGFFRPGGEEYAEENGTFGLATIRKEHVRLTKGQLVFEYTAKGAKHREQAIAEDQVCAVVRSLKRRRGRRRPAAGVPQRAALARRDRGGHQRLHPRDFRRRLHRQGLPHLARDRAGRRRAWPCPGRPPARPPASGPSPAWSRRWPATSATPRPWPGPPTSTRASSAHYQDGRTIAAVLGDLGRDSDFGDLATRGRAEGAVLKLLAEPG